MMEKRRLVDVLIKISMMAKRMLLTLCLLLTFSKSYQIQDGRPITNEIDRKSALEKPAQNSATTTVKPMQTTTRPAQNTQLSNAVVDKPSPAQPTTSRPLNPQCVELMNTLANVTANDSVCLSMLNGTTELNETLSNEEITSFFTPAVKCVWKYVQKTFIVQNSLKHCRQKFGVAKDTCDEMDGVIVMICSVSVILDTCSYELSDLEDPENSTVLVGPRH